MVPETEYKEWKQVTEKYKSVVKVSRIYGQTSAFRFHLYLVVAVIFTPQPLKAVRVLFSPMVGGRREKVYPGCISETVRCRKLILGRDIG